MNANDVIESYVTDVALRLPRKQRNDVAFELRALLNEELQDKTEATGRTINAAMATEFLQAFGRPEDVAARYLPTLTIIDPADGPRFLRITVIGLAIIWCLGLFASFSQPLGPAGVLGALSHWWLSIVIPSLWWPGVLVVGFGWAAWARRRRPHTSTWKPRSSDRIEGGRISMVMGLIGILCGLFLLINPTWLLDVFWGGRAAPMAYQALTYTESFLQRQAPWLLALLMLNIPIFIIAIMKGCKPTLLRRIETAQALTLCAVIVWTIVDGPVFMTSDSDRTAKFFALLIVVFTLITFAIKLYRTVRPMPNRSLQTH